ncbi:MAG: DUF3667 domain-containing protein [Xanthomonadales bacterium]|nr:DUF3667 domain-containing protein [Xanthomonadales bacterium]
MSDETADLRTLPAPLPRGRCANCGAPMYGAYCAICGQPEKGLIRHLISVLADAGEALFNVDSRVFRSIAPLYLRPGYLTIEYFAGRRARYVTPFRLFFFLCILCFFAIQFTINVTGSGIDLRPDVSDVDELSSVKSAPTLAELDRRSEAAFAAIAAGTPDAAARQKRIDTLTERVGKRGEWLRQRDAAIADGAPLPDDPNERAIEFNGRPWDPVKHPLEIGWAPDWANRGLNASLARVRENVLIAEHDPAHLFAGVFSVLPQTMFVLLPLFALLLKLMYVFKRRLYMEHLMVALHSHAFIFLSLLLLALLQLVLGWAEASAALLVAPLRWLRAAMWAWLPLYLLLMQKRVYAQGWTMTLLKYSITGWCYVVLLSFAVAAAMLISLALN